MKEFDLKDLLKQIPVWNKPIKFKNREKILTENEKKVLSFLRACKKKGVTIQDIAENTGVKPTTVKVIINRFLNSIIVKVKEEKLGRFGRKSNIYRLKI